MTPPGERTHEEAMEILKKAAEAPEPEPPTSDEERVVPKKIIDGDCRRM